MIIILFFLIFFLILIMISFYFYQVAINAKTDKSAILSANQNSLSQSMIENGKREAKWFDQSLKEEVCFFSHDHLKLHAYQFLSKKKTNYWIILSHGYFGDASQVAPAIHDYVEHDYNVLAIEARGHGKSEGNYIGLGYDDRKDVITWIEYLIAKNANAKIILHGVSMGATTTMITIGEDLPKQVCCAIADCGYTSAIAEFQYQLRTLYHLPSFPILPILDIIVKRKAHYSLKQVDALKALAKSNIPILFFQGDQDTFVPSFMVEELYHATKGQKEMKIIKGAGHGESSLIDAKLYWNTVFNFIRKNTE